MLILWQVRFVVHLPAVAQYVQVWTRLLRLNYQHLQQNKNKTVRGRLVTAVATEYDGRIDAAKFPQRPIR